LVHLGVGHWQQQEPGDAQYGCRERLQQTRSGGRVFGAVHTLSPLCGVVQQPERIAGSTLIADRMFNDQRAWLPGH